MKEEKCPCCPNHCEKDNLGCGRGRDYFNNSQNNHAEPKTKQDQVIEGLRKCGHMLHHRKELMADDILSNFSEEELDQFHTLLSKINGN